MSERVGAAASGPERSGGKTSPGAPHERANQEAQPGELVTFADLAGEVLARPPRLGGVRFVAIDGPAGSGKTTFADRLTAALGDRLTAALGDRGGGVVQIGVDDLLDGWDGLATWWAPFAATVLTPLSQGRVGSYRRYDWHAGRFADPEIAVPVPEVLVVEGVGSARAAAAGLLTAAIWVSVESSAARLARLMARDGAELRPSLERWMAVEAAHFAADRTVERADHRVAGAPTVAHDPAREYVRGTVPGRPRVDGVAWLRDDPRTGPRTACPGGEPNDDD